MSICSKHLRAAWCSLLAALILSSCTSVEVPPLQAIDQPIELERFMGDWYVVGFIPIDNIIGSEAGAHNAIESYALRDDGKIQVTYTFRKDAFDGEEVEFAPVGWVDNTETNSAWRMQFIWPFHSSYLIAYLDEDYQQTIIGVPNRDYVWIMTRTPNITAANYTQLLEQTALLGYDINLVQKVPQQWPD
jgi:apolipoprotein D and lipocalin family protein